MMLGRKNGKTTITLVLVYVLCIEGNLVTIITREVLRFIVDSCSAVCTPWHPGYLYTICCVICVRGAGCWVLGVEFFIFRHFGAAVR